MGDSNKQICRLCLEVTPSCECETIDEFKKGILGDLQIDIDFDVINYAVACSRCLERLQDCFEFKSQVTASMEGDFKVDITKVFERERSNENSYPENCHVCLLCTSVVEDKAFNHTTDLKDGVCVKDMIRNCFPEAELNTDRESLICKPCLSSLDSYYEFMKNCQRIEQRTKHYYQVAGRTTCGVIFNDMLKFKNCDEFSKSLIHENKCTDVENDENVMKCLQYEEITNIKCEEINIKNEIDGIVGMRETHQLGDYDCFAKGHSAERKAEDEICESKGKNHFCPKCPYASEKTYQMINHMRSHSVYKCFLCPLATDTDPSLKTHMTSHRGPTKAFGCRECPFEADCKYNILRHILKHKKKCVEKKSRAMTHKQRKPKIDLFHCQECLFITKYKYTFMLHQLKHKNPDTIPKHKCETCNYETIYKVNLRRHKRIHGDPKLVNKFQCGKCAYRTKWPGDLKRHMAKHVRQQTRRSSIPASACVEVKSNPKISTIKMAAT